MRLGRPSSAVRGAAGLETRPLGRRDQASALGFLDLHPGRDVFIASRILHDGALGPLGWSPLWGAFDSHGELRGVLHVGPNLVPAANDAEVIEAFAAPARGPSTTRMLVGERRAVERLWELIASTYPRPREIRARQYVYTLVPDQLLAPPGRGQGRARLATPADEEPVLRLSAAMYAEEMGENPLTRDPTSYRRRVRILTSRDWTYVFDVGGDLQFKMDIGCASPRSAQIQGVFVPPELRGRGVATKAMAACCQLAFQRHPSLSLYVNDFNRPAVALYERLGFRREAFDFQTIMLP